MKGNQTPQHIPNFEDFFQAMLSWPLQTQLGLFVAAVIWLIGGNILMYISMKRRGIPYWKSFFPTPSGFNAVFGLNKNEWIIVIILAISSLSFGAWGIAGAH